MQHTLHAARRPVSSPVPPTMATVGVVQMTSRNLIEHNFEANSSRAAEAKALSCEMVCFPECFSFIGARAGEAQQIAEPLDGPLMARYKKLAKDTGIWLSLGGFQEKCDGDDRIFNTHVVLTSSGGMAAVYRKIHLFDVPMVGLVESKQAISGADGPEPHLVVCDSPAGRLGVTICYDMR